MIIIDSYRFINILVSIEYPPVAMTSNTTLLNGATGYIATTSTVYFDAANAEWKLFDKTTSNWNNSGPSYNTSTGAYAGTISTFDGTSNVLGEWIQIKLPSPIQLTSYSIQSRTGALDQLPKRWRIYGADSTNPTSFTFLQERLNQVGWSDNVTRTYALSAPSASFSVYRIVIMENNGGGFVAIGEWRLFTNQIPGGYPLEYPAIALTADTNTISTTISSASYGNGTYTLTTSGQVAPSAFNAFDKNNGTFINFNSSTYNTTSPFAYNGTITSTVSGVVVRGDWMQIELPTIITLTSYSITPRNDGAFAQCPRSFTIAGTNDGITYFLIDSRTNIIWTQGTLQSFTIASPSNSYNRYRLIIQAASQFPAIVEWRLFGF